MSEEKKEVLVVMSKVKAYIKAAGLLTSSTVADALSDKIKALCDAAIANAKKDKRKTVMDKDF
jgi:histone H3/H4